MAKAFRRRVIDTWRQGLGEGKVALVFFMFPNQRGLVERLLRQVAFIYPEYKASRLPDDISEFYGGHSTVLDVKAGHEQMDKTPNPIHQ